jgi:riboflavin synthase
VFTGIVAQAVKVVAAENRPNGRRLVLDLSSLNWHDLADGESVAVNGCCLTAAGVEGGRVGFDAVRETLDKTNLGTLAVGDFVHVERPLLATDRLDGHFVQGHVDGPAEVVAKRDDPNDWRMTCRVAAGLAEFLVPKGSVCLDGVSLTVADLRGDEFDVALIPTTLGRTTFANRPIGWKCNFEADVLVKAVVHRMKSMNLRPSRAPF